MILITIINFMYNTIPPLAVNKFFSFVYWPGG